MTDRNVEPNRESETSTTLLQRLVQNQPAAWERLVELYGPLVYGWCRNWGAQPCDAENVGQETFLKVAQHLAGFRRERPGDTFRGWLYRIARNTFVDYLRRRPAAEVEQGSKAERLLAGLSTQPEELEEEQFTRQETAMLYRKALALIQEEFAARDWEACQGLMNGLPAREVAAGLGVTTNVVYLAKSRILRRLREEFAELLPDAELGGETSHEPSSGQ
jgi:RNA polymerase sigma-70 factor (ECF subfamily)